MAGGPFRHAVSVAARDPGRFQTRPLVPGPRDGGHEDGQHDEIVAVQLSATCAISSFTVYGTDREVAETDLRHVRVGNSLRLLSTLVCGCRLANQHCIAV